jgi:YHS domain-containing protein
MKNQVLVSTKQVIKEAEDVKINREEIKKLAKEWTKEKIVVPDWPKGFHLETENREQMLDYLILLDSLNFCFWPVKQPQGRSSGGRWKISYKGKEYNGYFALSLALKKFFEENPQKGNLRYFSDFSFKEFKKMMQGGKKLQFLEKRWQIARAVSRVILTKYRNSENFLKSAKNRMSVLVAKIYKELPSFYDVGDYNGKKVFILKRAQILACDILGAFNGKGTGRFKDPEYLTAFADYKIPQILHYLGILEYSPLLEKKIKDKVLIGSGSKKEIEIRSSTIWAVEYLKRELKKMGRELNSFEIDWVLWNKAQEMKIGTPYHLTKTIYY